MSTYIRPNRKKLHDYEDCTPELKKFLEHEVVVKNLSVTTCNTYYVNARLFMRYIKMKRDLIDPEEYDTITISDISLDDLAKITSDDVTEYVFFLAGRGDSVTTRISKLSTVRMFYSFLEDKYPEKISKNPALKVEKPKPPQREPKYLSIEEAKGLLEATTKGPNPVRNYCIECLFLNSGMRLSELCKINVDDVKGNTLRVIGKGNKERTVYLNGVCIEALTAWLDERGTYEYLLDKDALFVSNKTKRRLTGRAIEKIIEKDLARAGLSGMGYSPHKLRHTAATLMHDSGADMMDLKEILGHSHVSTTEIYTHVNSGHLRRVTDMNPLNEEFRDADIAAEDKDNGEKQ